MDPCVVQAVLVFIVKALFSLNSNRSIPISSQSVGTFCKWICMLFHSLHRVRLFITVNPSCGRTWILISRCSHYTTRLAVYPLPWSLSWHTISDFTAKIKSVWISYGPHIIKYVYTWERFHFKRLLFFCLVDSTSVQFKIPFQAFVFDLLRICLGVHMSLSVCLHLMHAYSK